MATWAQWIETILNHQEMIMEPVEPQVIKEADRSLLTRPQRKRAEALREAYVALHNPVSAYDMIPLAQFVIDGENPFEDPIIEEDDQEEDDQEDDGPVIESVTRTERSEWR